MTISWAKTPADRAKCYAIRHEVFVDEQKVPIELEQDAQDDIALHVLASDRSGFALATARMVIDYPQAGVAKIGRVAVRYQARHQGYALAMMRFLENAARKSGQHTLVLDAQVAVLGLYEKLGYLAHGPVFDDAGIDHRRMKKSLA